jgi:hypothetical protein
VSSLPQTAAAFQAVLVDIPAVVSRRTGFEQRRGKLSGAGFVQTLVFGWWQHPEATLEQLCQTAAALGTAVSPQALAQRFTPGAAALLADRLAAAAAQVLTAAPAAGDLLGRFAAVELLDSTTVGLPDALATVWRGCGGRTATGTQAALKVTVRLDLVTGRLTGPELNHGRTQDRATALHHAPVAAGGLRVNDLGFTTLGGLAEIAAQDAYFLSRLPTQWGVRLPDGSRLGVEGWLRAQDPAAGSVERSVELGLAARVPARLLALPVPPEVAAERRRKLRAAAKREGKAPSAAALARADWTLLVTNAPAALLAAGEAAVLARARWQIELLFKLWKQHGKLEESRGRAPWRVLCEAYAKLLVVVAQHWATLVGGWAGAARSPVKLVARLRGWGLVLALALTDHARLVAVLVHLQRSLSSGSTRAKRRNHPATFQLLATPPAGRA